MVKKFKKLLIGMSASLLIILIGLIIYFVTKKSPGPGPTPTGPPTPGPPGPGPTPTGPPTPGPGPTPPGPGPPGPGPTPPGPGPPGPGPYWTRSGAHNGKISVNNGYATITSYSVGKGTFGVNGTGEGQTPNSVHAWTAAAPFALYDMNTTTGAGTSFVPQHGNTKDGIVASWKHIPVDTNGEQLCYKLTLVDDSTKTINVQIMETCGGNCAYKSNVYNSNVIPDCPTLSGGGGLTPWGSTFPIKLVEVADNDQWGQDQYNSKFRCPAAQLDAATRDRIHATLNNLPLFTSTGDSTVCGNLPDYLDWCGGNFMHFDVDSNSPFKSTGLVEYTRIDCKSGDIFK